MPFNLLLQNAASSGKLKCELLAPVTKVDHLPESVNLAEILVRSLVQLQQHNKATTN